MRWPCDRQHPHLTAGKSSVDMDVLRRIGKKVKAPLVLHGGTSIAYDRMRDLVCLGVPNSIFEPFLKQAYLDAVKAGLAKYERPSNPHPFLGMGTNLDINGCGREAVKGKVKELLHACGSTGG